MTKKYGLALSLLFSLNTFANLSVSNPQDDTSQASWVDNILENLGADGGFDNTKAIDFSVLPGPFYNPEMSLGVGISAIGLYQIDEQDTVSQTSSLVINGFASVNGSVGVVIDNRSFLKEDQWRVYVDAEIADAPDVYYGIGYQQNRQDDNRVNFDHRQLSLRPMLLKRVSESAFIGAGFDLSYAKASDIDDGESLVDSSLLDDSSSAVGVSFQANFDTRDVVRNPYEGRLLQLDLGLYHPSIGSSDNFQTLSFNYSEYLQLGPRDSLLAWQFKSRFTYGDTPWHMLSTVGGGSALRGYTTGRYRDKQMVMSQAEYRWDLPGRHGMVFWLGAGAIAPQLSLFSSDEILPNVGLGYRFEVKSRVNLRLDMGFGDGESGFYFNVDEAF
ncbi:BamA/TamA family outer membrane protein [Agarivorans sp. TSD2052]|uniref:BamA/TamA family outer membrane protein n=1 Tax=Agarivorans sp. TSD2052 TaxID=2937286 RepID=UPI00200FCD2B|nr:BamA/TamA family outer membrane protein [Agarivorans sp. TSD2052]UPW17711.1 BamA/TamA family outer membrane protein [Agarivorans sp. TSD2052]